MAKIEALTEANRINKARRAAGVELGTATMAFIMANGDGTYRVEDGE